MHSTLNVVGVVAAFASGAVAASTSAYLPTSDVQAWITAFAPTATSVSPSQLSKIYSDLNKYEGSWEAGLPSSDPVATDTKISDKLYSQIEDAEYNGFFTPSAALASLSVLASGLPESAALMAYESSLIVENESWTTQASKIVASDLGQAISTPTNGPSSAPGSTNTASSSSGTSSSSGLAAAPTAGAGVMAGAAVAAAGVVGMALL